MSCFHRSRQKFGHTQICFHFLPYNLCKAVVSKKKKRKRKGKKGLPLAHLPLHVLHRTDHVDEIWKDIKKKEFVLLRLGGKKCRVFFVEILHIKRHVVHKTHLFGCSFFSLINCWNSAVATLCKLHFFLFFCVRVHLGRILTVKDVSDILA